MVSENIKEYLDGEVEKFSLRFNNCRARFAKITGKRISHISGETDSIRWGELKLHINSSVVLFVDGVWDEMVTDISCYARKLADHLREISEVRSQEPNLRSHTSYVTRHTSGNQSSSAGKIIEEIYHEEQASDMVA